MLSDPENVIEDRFKAAVNVIRGLPKDGPYQPSHDMMLKFYGLYKQATEGPCEEPKPSFYEVVKGYKWRAWSNFGTMSKTAAMNTYVEELKKIVETMSYSDDVAAFMDSVGPFYEYVDIISGKGNESKPDVNMNREKNEPNNTNNYQLDTFEMIPKDLETPNHKGIQNSESLCMSDTIISTDKKEEHLPSSNHINGFISYQQADSSMVNGSTNGDTLENGAAKFSCSAAVSLSKDNLSRKGNEDIVQQEKDLEHFKKLISDTESDEEYSEPAETPELLREKKTFKRNAFRNHNTSENQDFVLYENSAITSQHEGSPVLQVVTFGGGDAQDAGRIRFAQSFQMQQAGEENRNGELDNQRAPPPIRGGRGAGGGRRRRDSEDSRDSRGCGAPVDINAQLVLILQKIHQDLEAVVARLSNLETQALSQHQEICGLCQRRLGLPFAPSEKTSWWPFPELSPRSTFFLLTWPLILHGALKLLIFLRARRRRKLNF